MSRKRKPPVITEQIKVIIVAAIEDHQYNLAKKLTDLLEEMESTQIPKEGE
jgi:hypothetical protein